MENRYHVSINHIARLVILIANKRLSKISINRNLKKKSFHNDNKKQGQFIGETKQP